MVRLSAQLRWLVVWKRVLRRHTWKRIQRALGAGPDHPGPGKSQMKGIVKRYRKEGGVDTYQGIRPGPPANKVWSFRRDKQLIDALLDAPGDMLDEIRRKFTRRSGVKPSTPLFAELSTVWASHVRRLLMCTYRPARVALRPAPLAR